MIAFLTSVIYLPIAASGDEEGGLVENMNYMQTWMHKTALSLDARNPELVYFYTHELEETIEAVEEIEQYKKFNIEVLTEQILEPEFEKFEALVKASKLEEANAQFNNVVNACNECHNKAGHGFIKIVRTTSNPFMQDFGK